MLALAETIVDHGNRLDNRMDLFALGQQYFNQFMKAFAVYGLDVDPGLSLRPGHGLLCYYDLKDGQIYLSVPGTATPEEELKAVMLASLLGCDGPEELIEFFARSMPWLMAHELGHYFRHRYGLFGDNLWREEQIANQLALAMNKSRISPVERAEVGRFLERAMKRVAAQLGTDAEDAIDSYGDIAMALQTEGQISDIDAANLELVRNAFSGSSATLMLRKSGNLQASLEERLSQRGDLIASMNAQYTANAIKYMYYQIGWIKLAMESRDTYYVSEFCREHLRLAPPGLELSTPKSATVSQVRASYGAYTQTKRHSTTASRYFYKRYRSLLLNYLKTHKKQVLLDSADLPDESFEVLTTWDDSAPDPLNYLIGLSAPSVRALFPSQIALAAEESTRQPDELASETDRRVWDGVVNNKWDAATSSTLSLLAQLDRLEMFRNLPAEAALELARRLLPVRYDAGDTVVWQGEENEDVFVVTQGQLEVLITHEGRETQVAVLEVGDVIGEVSWLTKGARTATVRALTPAACLVIKDSGLQVMAFRNPTILMQIAGAVARRLTGLYQTSVEAEH
jgi:hypothetical protein